MSDIKHDLYRKRKTNNAYHKHMAEMPAELACEFCTFQLGHPQVLEDYGNFWLVQNKFPYDVWDRFRVLDHIFLTPKRHIHEIAEFNAEEEATFIKAVKEFEGKGYCVYARAKAAKSKSVPHQHTHFMMLDDKPVHTIFYNKNVGRLMK